MNGDEREMRQREVRQVVERSALDEGSAKRVHRSRLRGAVQVVAFAVGIVLVVWAGSVVLGPDNREMFERLREASIGQVLLLAGLCAATVLMNGTCFWVTILPVKRLRNADVQATNAVASLLSYLPFKLSVVFRVVMHTARDGLNVLTVGAWFGCVGALMLAAMGPVLLAGWWRQKPDAAWAIAAVGGAIAAGALVLLLARLLKNERRWGALAGWLLKLPWPGFARRLLIGRSADADGAEGKPGLLERAHEGVRMMSSPTAVFGSVAARLGDIGVHTGRFLVAGAILGQELPVDQAVLAGSVFFLIGVFAPAGQVGVREVGTAGLLGQLLPSVDFEPFMVVVALISVTELLTLLVLGAAGLAWLRPGRLKREAAERQSDRGAQ